MSCQNTIVRWKKEEERIRKTAMKRQEEDEQTR
jgi:hypothetical protein